MYTIIISHVRSVYKRKFLIQDGYLRSHGETFRRESQSLVRGVDSHSNLATSFNNPMSFDSHHYTHRENYQIKIDANFICNDGKCFKRLNFCAPVEFLNGRVYYLNSNNINITDFYYHLFLELNFFHKNFESSLNYFQNLTAKRNAEKTHGSTDKLKPSLPGGPTPQPSSQPPHKQPSSSFESDILAEEIKHSITLAELTDVEKKEIKNTWDALSKNPSQLAPVKKISIVSKVVQELKHYYHGFRLLFINVRVSFSLLFRVLRGHTLRRREKNLLLRTVGDVFRLIPFSVFIVVPFMELLLPVFIKLFPGMLPTTFQTKADKEDKLRRSVKVKLEMAKFLQETLSDIAVARKYGCIKCAEDSKEFAKFFEKVRQGKGNVTNQEILKFSHLFSDNMTLDSLPRPQLVALCRVLDIQPFGTTAFLRFQIEMRLRSINADDQVIMKEGIDSLDLLELQQACQTRGMRVLGVPEENLRLQLSEWIALTQTSKVPEILVLLSRAFMYHEGAQYGQQDTAQHIANAISSLPESAAFIAKENVGGVHGKLDTKKEVELIKQQYKLIKEERKEEKAEKERLEAAKNKTEPVTKVDDNDQQYPYLKSEPVQVRGLLICQPVSKAPSDVISKEDAKTIEAAVQKLNRQIFTLEKEELGNLKDRLEKYNQSVKLLKKQPAIDISESLAARQLYKFTHKMTNKLDEQIKKLEDKEKALGKSKISSAEDLRKKLLQIDELVKVIEGLQTSKKQSNRSLKNIVEVLSKMALESDQGTVRLETLLKVMNLLQKEDSHFTAEQLDEVIEMIKKEEFIALHAQLEKTLQDKYENDIKSQTTLTVETTKKDK